MYFFFKNKKIQFPHHAYMRQFNHSKFMDDYLFRDDEVTSNFSSFLVKYSCNNLNGWSTHGLRCSNVRCSYHIIEIYL